MKQTCRTEQLTSFLVLEFSVSATPMLERLPHFSWIIIHTEPLLYTLRQKAQQPMGSSEQHNRFVSSVPSVYDKPIEYERERNVEEEKLYTESSSQSPSLILPLYHSHYTRLSERILVSIHSIYAIIWECLKSVTVQNLPGINQGIDFQLWSCFIQNHLIIPYQKYFSALLVVNLGPISRCNTLQFNISLHYVWIKASILSDDAMVYPALGSAPRKSIDLHPWLQNATSWAKLP